MKTRLEEATQRAMIMATHLFPYRGERVAEWFKTLPFEDRFKAFHVAHEMTKTRFSGPEIDSEERVFAVAKHFFRERSRLEDEAFKLVAPEARDLLRLHIED